MEFPLRYALDVAVGVKRIVPPDSLELMAHRLTVLAAVRSSVDRFGAHHR